MKLKVKDVNLSTGGPLVAIINEEDAESLGLRALDRIKIRRLRTWREINAVVDISSKGINKGEIGLFEEVLKALDLEEGVNVEVVLADRPKSVDYIKKKLIGKELAKNEIMAIITDLMINNLSEVELTYFVSGCYVNGLTLKESAFLTEAIVENGEKLNLSKRIILDKHSIGGVAGNRTTMVVVPIIAAAGYTIPKTSSRAITSAAGTADTFEILAPVALTVEKIKEVVEKTNGCIAWGGAMNLAGADDKLIKIRHPLRLDPEGMLLASILAKKKAVGATHVIIDIPYGKSVKVKTKAEGARLGKKFIDLGKLLNIKVKVVLTDGSQPIGNGIGPLFEAKDVISVLTGGGPTDLRRKSVMLATEMLKMVGVRNAHLEVLDVLNSGRAYEKLIEIIKAQGGRKHIKFPKPKHCFPIMAKKAGVVKEIDNNKINKIARIAGSPFDKTAGVYLMVKRGAKINKEDVLFNIYSKNKKKLEDAIKAAEEMQPIVY